MALIGPVATARMGLLVVPVLVPVSVIRSLAVVAPAAAAAANASPIAPPMTARAIAARRVCVAIILLLLSVSRCPRSGRVEATRSRRSCRLAGGGSWICLKADLKIYREGDVAAVERQ